ncbi:hypothetical protein BU26DRAFT_505325 [Trematosphaeria pertusa]|uniref:Fungal N-terminal domain-containing protein n=1 Tax=Trematosphaeria pertusa TaxID=390896 RepID=A0A6A6IFQ7_9PLEO|nr:uncharacterized protein BU26DRAFT_505325 [Trematosphaeria pertusa]KAF2249271.1 hypothetical protein BU26DRAFT_505325 [Trematosphaeria pertusa]
MAALGDILSIAHVLKRAYDLYNNCQSAPSELRLAREHIHALALCLEGVKSDLVNNPRSFVHQRNDIARTRQHALKAHVGLCEKALRRMERLLKKYQGFKQQHVSLWDRFRWSTDGKKEIAECKADLVVATSVLDVFLSKEGISVLWRLEGTVEALTRQIDGLARQLGALAALVPPPVNGERAARPRSGSNVTRTLVLSLVLARLRKALRGYRRKKLGGRKKTPPLGGPKRPHPATRVNSGFKLDKKRSETLRSYASNIATAASPPPPYKPRRTRTPSPDFYYLPNNSSSPPPKPIRRSSSMQRLLGRGGKEHPAGIGLLPAEHYECWKVGVGSLAFGPKTAPQFLPHRRGQMQLRKMAAVFKEASLYDGKALNERDARVKLLLNEKNKREKKKKGGSGKTWYFVAARVVKRDPGKSGMVVVEKAIVILVRR